MARQQGVSMGASAGSRKEGLKQQPLPTAITRLIVPVGNCTMAVVRYNLLGITTIALPALPWVSICSTLRTYSALMPNMPFLRPSGFG